MDNSRDNEIIEFLDNLLGQNSYKISKIPGDASFRIYSRISQDKKSYMLMDSPPEVESNHVFFQIANHLKVMKLIHQKFSVMTWIKDFYF